MISLFLGFKNQPDVTKNLPANVKNTDSILGSKILGKEMATHFSIFHLPGKFCGHRRLVGYSPCGLKKVDMTQR